MPLDIDGLRRPEPLVMDRRRHRVELPDCPNCQQPLRVDVRSTDTLYARCEWCGHRRMVPKPGDSGA